MAKPRNFLFVCQGNDARSQMAEGFAKAMANGTAVNVYSAGVKPKQLDKYAVDVMAEVDIDISVQETRTFNDVPVKKIDTIITLSSDSDPLPKTKSKVTQIHWPLTDPTAASGTEAEVKKAYRAVRDEIRNRVQVLLVG